MNFQVSQHALDRYRERVALYGDAPPREVVEALRNSVPATNEPLPFIKKPWAHYWRHRDNPNIYFVTEPRYIGHERVVTIIDVSEKFKVKPEPQKVEGKAKNQPQPKSYEPVPEPNHHFEPSFASDAERYEWLSAEMVHAKETCAKLPSKHPQKFSWVCRKESLRRQMAELLQKHKELVSCS